MLQVKVNSADLLKEKEKERKEVIKHRCIYFEKLVHFWEFCLM